MSGRQLVCSLFISAEKEKNDWSGVDQIWYTWWPRSTPMWLWYGSKRSKVKVTGCEMDGLHLALYGHSGWLNKNIMRSNGLAEQQITGLDRSSDKNGSKKLSKNRSETKKNEVISSKGKVWSRDEKKNRCSFALRICLSDWIINLD